MRGSERPRFEGAEWSRFPIGIHRGSPVYFDARHHEVAHRAAAFASEFVETNDDVNQLTVAAVKDIASVGLTAFCVPESYGGAAVGSPEQLDCRSLTLIRESLGWSSALLDTAFAMQGLGSYPISLAGTPAQKSAYLPGVLAGDRLGAFALTEPSAGSDVAAMACTAKRVANGYLLNGKKTYISNAGIAGQYVVFAKTNADAGRRGISAFIVDGVHRVWKFSRST